MARPPVVRLRQSLLLPLLLGGVWFGAGASLQAQVTGAGLSGLKTTVNGVVGGSCSAGLCQVSGGTAAGSNLFHRFSSFDTRGAITGVQINTFGLRNVLVGVTAPLGTFIDKPVSLSSPGNLFWLSPGGIAISGSGGFINATQLTLTTATNQLIGAGRFDVFGTTPEQAALLTGTPGTRARDLVLDPAARALAGMDPDPTIEFNGVQITVDRSLLVDNPAGLVAVTGSTLSASSRTGQGGSLTLTGPQVWVDGTSNLLATGPSGGGLIQVGGSWQNSDIDVRQAYTTWVGQGALLDASATAHGNGGTIVVWSDITNPASATAAYGTLRAMGGPQGGNGGQIETSGKWLSVSGISVSTLAPKGMAGLWLLDPASLTINNTLSSNVTPPTPYSSSSTVPLIVANTSQPSYLQASQINTALLNSNVAVEAEGDIEFYDSSSPSIVFYTSSYPRSLTFRSKSGDINVNSSNNIVFSDYSMSGGSSLIFEASGGLTGSGGIRLQSYGSTLPSLVINQAGNTTYSGVFEVQSGFSAPLFKKGSGTLTLSPGGTQLMSPVRLTVSSGVVALGNTNSLSGGSDLIVSGGTFDGGNHSQSFNSITISSGSILGTTGVLSASSFASTDGGSISANLGGNGSFDKTGAGTLILSGSNTFAGLAVMGGVVRALSSTALGAGWVSVFAGAAVELQGDIQIANNLTIKGTGPSSSGALRNLSGSNTITGLVTWAGGTSNISADAGDLTFDRARSGQNALEVYGFTSPGVDLVVGGSGNINFMDPINLYDSSSGIYANLVKSGSGTLSLVSGNAIGAKISLLGGALAVSSPDFWSSSSAFSRQLMIDGAVFQSSFSGAIATNGDGSVLIGSGGGTWRVDSGNSIAFDGVISGSGSFTKAGSGELNLGAANTFTGATNVNEGTLAVSGSLSDSTALTVASGATYQLGASDTIGSIAGSGSIALDGATLTAGAGIPSSANVSVGTFSGSISGSGGLIKAGSGTMTLAGANTYTGATTVNDGTLLVTGRLSDSTALTVNSGATYQLGASDTIGSIAGRGSIALGSATLTTGAAIPSSGNASLGTFSGSISGSGGLTKVGSGTMTLAGANTYTGATTVNDGTLLVTGSLSDSTALTVNSGATYQLGASDTIGSIAGNGTIALGSSTLTAGANSSSTAFDGSLTGSGNLVKSGKGTLTLNGANSYTGSTTVTGGVLTVNRRPPNVATCTGGSSNICASSSASQQAQTSVINSTPGFSVASTTETASPTSASGNPVSTDSSSAMGSASTSDDSTLISSSDTSVTSSLESSFTASDGDSSLTSDGGDAGDGGATGSGSTESGADTADNGNTQDSSVDGGDSTADGSGQDTDGNQALNQGDGSASESGAAAVLPPTTEVPSQQAAQSSQQAEQRQAAETVNALAPERSGTPLSAPSVPQMQKGLSDAASQVRSGRTGGGLGPQSRQPFADQEWLLAGASQPVSSDAGRPAMLPPTFNRAAYTPAVMHVRFSDASGGTVQAKTDAFLDITLIPMQGEVEGRRVEVSKKEFAALLKQLYVQLSRQESLQTANPASPSRRLYDLVIGPMAPELAKQGITTLLISADRGLQAVPFAALHSGERYFGDAYAFALTPSLALTNLTPPQANGGRLLAAGSAVFDGLAPLPLVPTELQKVGQSANKDIELNKAFTPATLLEQAADSRYSRVHVATHAEFLPGGPAASKLYSGTVPISLREFVKLRRARADSPLDLISFSACRTALGDADSELGFAGLALQAGARSAVGTLWYVDDVATSAYFVQMYRYLDGGVPKAEALQLTRQAFSRGLVRLDGDRVLGPDEAVLLNGLTDAQQRRVAEGLTNPYFWAGIELLGSPW